MSVQATAPAGAGFLPKESQVWPCSGGGIGGEELKINLIKGKLPGKTRGTSISTLD